jgi:hypothetical protein
MAWKLKRGLKDFMKKLILLSAMSLFLVTACAGLGAGLANSRQLPEDQVHQIVVKKTTRAELLAMFGPTTDTNQAAEGKTWLTWHPYYAGPFGVRVDNQHLLAIVGADDKVEQFTYSNRRSGTTIKK